MRTIRAVRETHPTKHWAVTIYLIAGLIKKFFRPGKRSLKLSGAPIAFAFCFSFSIQGLADTFTVNSTGDAGDMNVGNGACATMGGVCTLRAAIQETNALVGADTINFSIPGPANHSSGGDSWWQITPATALPAISGANTIIDATTQTTNRGNTNSLGPEIELNGASVGAGGVDGLGVISPATGVVIKGFIINRWSGAGISLYTGTGSNTVTGNYIGTNYAGVTALANTSYGIYVNTNGNTIGGATAVDRNVIAGNGGPGLYVAGNNNTIQGNYIGVNATASAALANTTYGINILSTATGNTIGGTAAGASNVISGNTSDGINHSASGTNTVQGNYIGTNASSASLPNGGDGIDISAGTINLGNASESQSNVIGPNTGAGINLAGGTINLAGTINVRDDITLSTGTLAMGSATLNLSGNWTRTSATITPGTSTVVLNGTTNQIITSGGGASFYNLTLNNTGASGSDNIDIVGALDVNGALTLTDGVLDISNTAPANNATVNTAGNVTIGTNGSVNVTGRTANWTFDGVSILIDSSSGGPQQLNDVIVNGTSLTLGSSAKMKTLTVTAGTINLGASGYILELTGAGTPLSNSGTFSAGTSTVKYTGTTTTTNVATVPYSSLWLAPTAATTYSLAGNLTGGNAMTGNLTVDANATLDATSANNYNLSAVNVTINGTYTARSSTITASGNWNHTNGTFNYGASTVNLTGTGTITINMASWWTKPFYNLTAAAAGQTTNFNTTLGVSVINILTLGTGTVTGGQVVLEKPGGTPFVNAGATLSNTAFRYQTDSGPVNIAAAAYPILILATTAGAPTFSLAGNITCSNLQFFFNQPSVSNTLSLNTSASNYSITCTSLELGVTGATATQNTILNLNSSIVTFTSGVTIHPNTMATLTGGTLNVGGNWTNNGNFTASSGAIVLTGANQTITGNSIFNNFTKSVTAAQTLNFAAGSTTTINGTATINGASGQLLSLRSSTPGTRWNFNLGASATKSISYVNVQDSDASGSAAGQKPIGPTNSTDAGNNIAWFAIPTVVKSVTVISDPVNNTINPKAIPGAVIECTITIANGAGGSTATNIVVTDNLNADIVAGRLAFNPNTYAAGQGIQVTAPNINGGAAKNLTNDGDADEGDFNVAGTNTVTVSGIALTAGQSATVKFRVTVQ